jgi:hypothetical protein
VGQQNQTWRQEVSGGYLWSPKRKTNNQINAFYESMREVLPGDVILSIRDTLIAAIPSGLIEDLRPLLLVNGKTRERAPKWLA